MCPFTFCTNHKELLRTSTQVLIVRQMNLIFLLLIYENWKRHSEACTAKSSDSVSPLSLLKRCTNLPTGFTSQVLTHLPPLQLERGCLWTHLFLWTILFEYFFFQKSCLRTSLAIKANTENQGQEYSLNGKDIYIQHQGLCFKTFFTLSKNAE